MATLEELAQQGDPGTLQSEEQARRIKLKDPQELGGEVLGHRHQEVLLVAEVEVERAARQSRRAGDLVDGQVLVRGVLDELEGGPARRGAHLVVALAGVGAGAGGGGHGRRW